MQQIIEGTYDLILRGDFGNQLIKSNVVLRADEETVVDVSKELGVFRLISYDQIKERLSYDFYQGTTNYANNPLSDTSAGDFLCGTPGEYNISFNTYRSGYTFGHEWTVPHMILSNPISFKVEVRSGETTVAGPNTWPKQLGLVLFNDKSAMSYFDMSVYKLEDGEQTEVRAGDRGEEPFRSDEGYWILPGKYKIVLTGGKYIGIFYDFEIKAGEKIVLELPSSS